MRTTLDYRLGAFALAIAFICIMSMQCLTFGVFCPGRHPTGILLRSHLSSSFASSVKYIMSPLTSRTTDAKDGRNAAVQFDPNQDNNNKNFGPIQDMILKSFEKNENKYPLEPIITHAFSPFRKSDEFSIVSHTWRIAAEKAKEHGIEVELIGAVLPGDVDVVPDFARTILLKQAIPNYRAEANPVPTYGEIFQVLKNEAKGSIVIYSNADIAVVPDFYIKVYKLMREKLYGKIPQAKMLEQTRKEFFAKCKEITVDSQIDVLTEEQIEIALTSCARDSVVYFENKGGRTPDYPRVLYKYFRNATAANARRALRSAYIEPELDSRTNGNAITITRWQMTDVSPSAATIKLFGTANPDNNSKLNEGYLKELYENEGEYHPGNDLFILPKNEIPRLLLETPFIHLRPSGYLIGAALKLHPRLLFRRISSKPENPFTFHLGDGTNEFLDRVSTQARQVLFESAQYFTRLNLTKTVFFPPSYCENKSNYRIGGTSHFCGLVSGDHCRGWVRLMCTPYWYRQSKNALSIEEACEKVATGRFNRRMMLDEPFCKFCNDIHPRPKYRCSGRKAVECATFPCDGNPWEVPSSSTPAPNHEEDDDDVEFDFEVERVIDTGSVTENSQF